MQATSYVLSEDHHLVSEYLEIDRQAHREQIVIYPIILWITENTTQVTHKLPLT